MPRGQHSAAWNSNALAQEASDHPTPEQDAPRLQPSTGDPATPSDRAPLAGSVLRAVPTAPTAGDDSRMPAVVNQDRWP